MSRQSKSAGHCQRISPVHTIGAAGANSWLSPSRVKNCVFTLNQALAVVLIACVAIKKIASNRKLKLFLPPVAAPNLAKYEQSFGDMQGLATRVRDCLCRWGAAGVANTVVREVVVPANTPRQNASTASRTCQGMAGCTCFFTAPPLAPACNATGLTVAKKTLLTRTNGLG